MTDPTYEDFKTLRRGSGHGWTAAFVATLVPGEPRLVSLDGRTPETAQNTLSMYRTTHKIPLRTSRALVPGELWVCLMKPEDVK